MKGNKVVKKLVYGGMLLAVVSTVTHAANNQAGVKSGPTDPVPAASFDCRKASTPAEKTICSDPTLAALDSAMASVYRRVRAQLPTTERHRLVLEQRAWLKEVRDRCGDGACIAQAYTTRQMQLQARQQARPHSIKQVTLGMYHSCTLTAGGAVSCRGDNRAGQIGHGKLGGNVARPTRVIAQGATSIAAGDYHSCAVVKGALRCWGNNYYGTVGNGKSGEGSDVSSPTKVIASGVKAVSAGGSHTCAVVNESLRCWGSNSRSQLGRGVQQSIVLQPSEIIAKGVTGVSAGKNHTCAIIHDTLHCWGYNSRGQIGNGTSDNHVPDPVLVIGEGVTAVSAGDDHTCAIANGALYCWGNNSSGEIGAGKAGGNALKPVLVIAQGVTSVTTDVGGEDGIDAHTCAIVDQALYCWGNNFYGQIGNGPPGRNVRAPVRVIESGVTAVSARGHHTCAVVNGAEQCWRYSVYGEIDPRPPAAARLRPAPQSSPSTTDLDRYLGTFKGSFISIGTEFVITRFFLNSGGEMIGEYTTIPYEGSSKNTESGTLDACQALPDSELHCKWHDRHGTGLLVVQFDDSATEFRGNWYDDRRDRRVPHMKREYWLGKTSWNGVRQ